MSRFYRRNLWRGCIGAWCPSRQRFPSYMLLDYSPSNNHGTLTNMGATTDWTPSAGKVALGMIGSDDRVAVSRKYSFTTTSSFSVCGWLNPATMSIGVILNTVIGQRQNSTTFEWGLRVGSTGVVSFLPTTGGAVNGTTVLDVNRWYHLAATFVNGTATVFLNGLQEASASSKTISLNGAVGCSIGAWDDAASGGNAAGYIDEIVVHEPALDAAAIRMLSRRRGIMFERVPRSRRYTTATPPATNGNNLLLLGVG